MRRIAAAFALLAAAVAVVGDRAPGHALGPVRPITPFEVDTGGGFVGWIGDLDMSGRGETAGVRDDEVSDIGYVAFDDGDLEPMERGDGIGVSGNGCTAVVAEDGDGFASLRVINRCTGTDVVVAEVPFNINEATINVTFDGRFAAIHYREFVASTTVNRVQRFNTATGELIAMPSPPALQLVAAPELHSDISDDGRFVVAPVTDGQRTAIAVWDVAVGASTVVVDAALGRWAGFPSVSGDGEWIAFASNQPRDLGEVGRGPWVYVIARATGETLRVSPAEQPAYYTSISRDGTQVAFAVSNGVVAPPTTTTTTTTIPPIIILAVAPQGSDPVPTCPNPTQVGIWQLHQTCPPARIDVAFSSTPGLSGAQTETVSLDAAGQQTGEHWHPELSGNGRWVAWISNAGNSLIGQNADLDGFDHAYMRRRDPGLVVDDLTFPPVQVDTVTDASTTVHNTGRTSVWLDEITTDLADRFVAVGGTCVLGMSLPPGATCTVVVRFTPGPNPGSSSATLRVREIGHDPVVDLGALTGTATPIDTTTSSSTTTTTTVPDQPTVTTTTPPAQTTTTTRPATTTTQPGAPTLSATPNPVEFGSVAVGFASEPQNVTVRNDGAGGGLVQTSLGGAHPDDFWVRTNGCVGVTLAIGRDCQIEVLLIPTGGGVRTATLTIAAGTSVVEVTLRGSGTFQPRLVPMPAAVTEHGISTIYGQGFPPGERFTVTITGHDVGLTLQGTADATGLFRAHLPVAGQLPLGTYTLHVDGVADVFGDVEARLLVALGTFRPQGAGGPAFGNSNLIVSRGG